MTKTQLYWMKELLFWLSAAFLMNNHYFLFTLLLLGLFINILWENKMISLKKFLILAITTALWLPFYSSIAIPIYFWILIHSLWLASEEKYCGTFHYFYYFFFMMSVFFSAFIGMNITKPLIMIQILFLPGVLSSLLEAVKRKGKNKIQHLNPIA